MLHLAARTRPALSARSFSRTITAMSTRVHYDSKTCPYAQRSWIALIEKGLPFEIRQVDLNNKDAEFIKVYQGINPDPAASAKVPILIDEDGTQLIESQLIVDYLESRYPQPRLLPEDPAAAYRARLWVDSVSSQFTPAIFALLRATDDDGVAAGKAKLEAALKVLDGFLRQHGSSEGGDFFLGGTYGYAETCTTGFFQRALAALPAFRGVDPWEVVRSNKLDRLEKWMNAALARPSAQETKPADEAIIEGFKKFVAPLAN